MPVTILLGDNEHPFYLDEQQLCTRLPFFCFVFIDLLLEDL